MKFMIFTDIFLNFRFGIQIFLSVLILMIFNLRVHFLKNSLNYVSNLKVEEEDCKKKIRNQKKMTRKKEDLEKMKKMKIRNNKMKKRKKEEDFKKQLLLLIKMVSLQILKLSSQKLIMRKLTLNTKRSMEVKCS